VTPDRRLERALLAARTAIGDGLALADAVALRDKLRELLVRLDRQIDSAAGPSVLDGREGEP